MELFLQNFANIDSLVKIWPLLAQGLSLTLLLALVTLPLGLLAGLAVAVTYSFGNGFSRRLIIIMIDLLRSFPALVLLVLIYYSLPFFGISLPGFAAVVLALVINNTGYYGEIFRAGIESIPRSQHEAASPSGGAYMASGAGRRWARSRRACRRAACSPTAG